MPLSARLSGGRFRLARKLSLTNPIKISLVGGDFAAETFVQTPAKPAFVIPRRRVNGL
jgi:hypothetical protein